MLPQLTYWNINDDQSKTINIWSFQVNYVDSILKTKKGQGWM